MRERTILLSALLILLLGFFSYSDVFVGKYYIPGKASRLECDVDGDGKVNRMDYVSVYRALQGFNQYGSFSDVNNDGEITEEDLEDIEECIGDIELSNAEFGHQCSPGEIKCYSSISSSDSHATYLECVKDTFRGKYVWDYKNLKQCPAGTYCKRQNVANDRRILVDIDACTETY